MMIQKRADLFAARKRQDHDRQPAPKRRDRNPEQFLPDIHRLNLMRANEILGETKVADNSTGS